MISKSNFYIIKLKRNTFAILFLAFALCLVVFSKSNLIAVKSGLALWATSVVPSLFPFFVSTELLMHTNIIQILGFFLNPFMKPIFNIRGEGSFAFIMGIISGYPVGAKIATTFREKNICSKEECERLLSFTNNSGPLFIIGTVGILLFKNTSIGILLFITHFLGCITVGFIFRFWKKNSKTDVVNSSIANSSNINSNSKTINLYNLGEILSESITNSISTLLIIGGFVVLFSSIISILKSSGIIDILSNSINTFLTIFNFDTNFTQGFLTGLLEITNGISTISSVACKKISLNILLTAFLLGFGGISIFLQVLSIISKTDLSIKPYIYGKILHGLFATFYTYIFINIFPFFNLDL